MKAAGDSAFFAAARVACLSDSRRTLARRRSIFALFSATVLRVTLPVSCFLASSRARPIGPNNKHGSARILWNSSRQLAAGSYATAPKTPLPASIFTVVLHNANCSRFMHVRRRQFDAPVPASNSWYAVMLTPSLSLSLSLSSVLRRRGAVVKYFWGRMRVSEWLPTSRAMITRTYFQLLPRHVARRFARVFSELFELSNRQIGGVWIEFRQLLKRLCADSAEP